MISTSQNLFTSPNNYFNMQLTSTTSTYIRHVLLTMLTTFTSLSSTGNNLTVNPTNPHLKTTTYSSTTHTHTNYNNEAELIDRVTFANKKNSYLLAKNTINIQGDSTKIANEPRIIDGVLYSNGLPVLNQKEKAITQGTPDKVTKNKEEEKATPSSNLTYGSSRVQKKATLNDVKYIDGVLYINGEKADNQQAIIKIKNNQLTVDGIALQGEAASNEKIDIMPTAPSLATTNQVLLSVDENSVNKPVKMQQPISEQATTSVLSVVKNMVAPPVDITRPKINTVINKSKATNGAVQKVLLTDVYDEEIPCHAHYGHVWSNNTIFPYRYDLTQMPETVEFLLTHGFAEDFRMPCSGRVTSEFGPRWGRHHNGIDLDLETGDAVFAAFEGKVRIARYSSSYGYVVVIRHYNGLETIYAHLSKLKVKPNDVIKAGEILGLGGSTGRSTGSHLHFEVRYKGHPLNPREMVDFMSRRLKSHTFIIDKTYFSSSNPYESAHTVNGKKYYAHNHKDYSGRSKVSRSNSGSSRYYTIRRGDTLGMIARRQRTSVSKLCRLNGISSRTTLRVGKRLKVR